MAFHVGADRRKHIKPKPCFGFLENLIHMKKGDTFGEPSFRVTRARASLSQISMRSEVPKLRDPPARVLRKSSKRYVSDENNNNVTATVGGQNKKRAVLRDVTNVFCDNSSKNCLIPAKKKNSIPAKRNLVNTSKAKSQQGSLSQTRKSDETKSDKGKTMINEKPIISSNVVKPNIIDIDSDHRDPQMCTVYAHEIYSNQRVAELMHRPHFNFMETIQRDVTQSMRGVLVDWLVEISEEYKLKPDTLYLTIYLIDLFLSQQCIERPKLQLLGITCMLIASKYEEMLAPAVEEFCFITDNTYTKTEVANMETQVLNDLNFQISAPTTITFLRRFLRAAQASNKSPSLELECLANYLAELTLIDYNFLVCVPSTIAASAVFLARWMLDHSSHPWNDTLEHYTNYKTLELKNIIFALHGLHTSERNSPLTAIRSKYKQDKFKCVANLPSCKLPETLF